MQAKIIKFFKSTYAAEIIIFSFALLSRFIRLSYPKTYFFDEVYHVFTAQALFRWDPRAWEWWNTSPAGFAYEWTHPPLAKEFIAFSILLFGDNSFSWRFFSALFGTGSIILIYFITLSIFKNRKIAILASLVASLDGLMLVMSRIGMNDSYFLFFSLLAIFMFLKDRRFLMGIFLGLSRQ
jgi:dolichyl-phosphate-mannose-protein mannosyltransferase